MEANTIIFTILGFFISIIGYFLKKIHNDFENSQNINLEFREKVFGELGKLKGKYEQIEKQTQIEIKYLSENINRLTIQIEKLVTYEYNRKS